jgi:hypothetical protein
VCWRQERTSETAALDEQIRSLKWKLWHGQVDRAIQHLERIIADMTRLSGQGDLSARRALNLAQPLLTYIRSNRHSIVDYGARHRSGRRIATALAESAVNFLVAAAWSRSSRCNGHGVEHISCCRSGQPS